MALIGLCGNGIVVFIIASSRRRGQRSPVQLFLLHLAISDLLVCLLNIPLTIWVNFYYPEEDMAGASAVCKITRFVQVRLATQNRCNFWKLSTQNRQEFIFLLHGNGKFLQRVAKTAGKYVASFSCHSWGFLVFVSYGIHCTAFVLGGVS